MTVRPLIEAHDLRKEFQLGEQTVAALDGVDLAIQGRGCGSLEPSV